MYAAPLMRTTKGSFEEIYGATDNAGPQYADRFIFKIF